MVTYETNPTLSSFRGGWTRTSGCYVAVNWGVFQDDFGDWIEVDTTSFEMSGTDIKEIL